MEEIFDVAIIGTGPAGLSAAITLKIRNKKIILFGSKNLSEKIVKAHEIQNYPGFPAIKGSDLAQKLQAHIDNLGIEITEDIAGLLCAAIISDTLMFRSPTCTEVDMQAAEKLAEIANVNAICTQWKDYIEELCRK